MRNSIDIVNNKKLFNLINNIVTKNSKNVLYFDVVSNTIYLGDGYFECYCYRNNGTLCGNWCSLFKLSYNIYKNDIHAIVSLCNNITYIIDEFKFYHNYIIKEYTKDFFILIAFDKNIIENIQHYKTEIENILVNDLKVSNCELYIDLYFYTDKLENRFKKIILKDSLLYIDNIESVIPDDDIIINSDLYLKKQYNIIIDNGIVTKDVSKKEVCDLIRKSIINRIKKTSYIKENID